MYAYTVYALVLLSMLILEEVEEVFRIPEFEYFTVKEQTIAWWLPVMIMAGVYLVTRFKFWYIDEGDLRFDIH